MKLFGRSLTFKIGLTIVLVEIIVLSIVGVNYAVSFFSQIDQRVQDRIQLPAQLININLMRLVSISDRESVARLVGEEIEDAILVDNDGNVVFAFDASLRGQPVTSVEGINPEWFAEDSTGTIFERLQSGSDSFLVNIAPIQDPVTGDDLYRLYIKTGINAAEAEKARVVQLLIGGSISTVLATTAVIFLSFNRMIFSRLREQLRVLQLVEQGNLASRITGKLSSDEIGTLQKGFNSMIARLQELVGTLEDRVNERVRDLTVAGDVSRQITTELDRTMLLSNVAELTANAFKFYHVSIFLYSQEDNLLRLSQGTGEIGKKMVESGKQFRLEDQGLVPQAARTRKAQVANDVLQDPNHLKNPLLPETRSELAVPMLYRGQLIGVLDLQAQAANRFRDDDVRILTTLAEQIAIAVQNAQLFETVQEALIQAERANSVKSAFLASMSHELRTPLNSVINFTKFVAKGTVGPVNEEQVQMLNEVIDSAKHLLALINDVLDMSKIESGTLNLFVEDNVDLNALINSAITTGKSLIGDKPIKLEADVEPSLPLIRGDRQRILQILLNIVSNACKFTDEGSIKISARQQGDSIEINVQDTGPGIAPDDQADVFEPFKQTDTGLRQGGGTGLGMPISKNLAEAHGGRMWLESTPGKGATFFVVLPVKSETLTPINMGVGVAK